MADIFKAGPGADALEAFNLAACTAAEQAGDPLEGLIVIAISGEGITVVGKGDEVMITETQANVLCALAETFGCEVEVDRIDAEAVH